MFRSIRAWSASDGRKAGLVALIGFLAGMPMMTGIARADFDGPPKPRIDCSKPENKNKPQCQKQYKEMSADEVYNAAYWLAQSGHYDEALVLIADAGDRADPRILTAEGFAMRKLGRVDEAFGYYRRALSINPGLVTTRAYLGEAYLSKGDLAAALSELGEIRNRCGTACEAYSGLHARIARFETAAAIAHGG